MRHRTVVVTAGLAGATAAYAELQRLGRTYGATPDERRRRGTTSDDLAALVVA